MSLLSTVEGAVSKALNLMFPGGAAFNVPAGTSGKTQAQAAGVPTPGGVAVGVATEIPQVPGDASKVISDAGKTITSVGDFLSYVAWIFHPLNLLRAVEFAVGILLSGWGIYILTSRSARGGGGASSHPVISRALSVTPAGRAARTVQGRRMGRHEGQREAARMEARQKVTRPQREASAIERQQINRRAREAARETT